MKNRNYPQLVQEFTDRLLLVGINYDKKSKVHECKIELWCEINGFCNVTDQVMRLISIMDGEMTSEEMMQKLGLKHLPTFRAMFRNPALTLGLIAMTLPDKPTSSAPKYYLTEKGKEVLG